MMGSILFAAALLGVSATASPLVKRDNVDCFNATIRKEFLLSINTYQPYDPYKSDVGNLNQIRLDIADPTNQNQNAIECPDAIWNSTQQSLPSGDLTCSDPTISYKITSYTKDDTFSVIINQTFVQGDFSETVLASYNATPSDLNGGTCYANKGCSSWYIGGAQGHAIVYDVQKNGPPSTPFPPQCPPAPLPTPANWPIRYSSDGPNDPANTSFPVASQIGFDILTNAQNGYRVKCNSPAWDSTTQPAQPADWSPCPYISYIPGNWSFRIESYTDYKTFNLGIKQHICNEVQCQDNLAYANMTAATLDSRFSTCNAQNKCTATSSSKAVDAPIYAVENETTI